jgi:hypothetical protein
MITDPLALRVARRHAARTDAIFFRNVPAERIRVEYTNAGTISAFVLNIMLEP